MNVLETKQMSAILLEAEVEGGVEVDRCDDVCSTGGLVGWCGRDTQPGCRASGDLLWAWEHGGTSWQQALCIFLQYPVLWKPNMIT